MLENKETALIVKAKLERLREKLQDLVDAESVDLSMIDYTDSYESSDIFDMIDEIDSKIAEITKKHLM